MYLKALKKFQKRARGLIKDSPEYTQLRNQIYKELRDDKFKQQNQIKENVELFKQYQDSMIVANFNSFYCLLIVVPENLESYETHNILKYYDFPMQIDEENILKPEFKKEMGFKTEDEVSRSPNLIK